MNPDIKRLYLFHFFLSLSLAVVASQLFLDKILLRMGLNMSQFGLIKGLGFLVPVTLNLMLSPYILRLRRDREITSLCYLARVMLPYLFLLLPQLTEDRQLLTLGCTLIFMTSMIFPSLANNSLLALCKTHIPRDSLGRHMARIMNFLNVPGFLVAVGCGWYIDRHSSGTDTQFYTAFLHVLLLTTIFQGAASWIMLRVSRREEEMQPLATASWREIQAPFKDERFRVYLNALFMLNAVSTMIIFFINPYLLEARGMSMTQISAITAVVSGLGIILRTLWGDIIDRFGGRNVLQISVLGAAAGIFCLTGPNIFFVLLFALLTWNTSDGIFGSGISTGQQYLNLLLSEENKANVYLAASTFVVGVAVFAGSLLGGFLLDWIRDQVRMDRPYSYYRIYFTYAALGYLLVARFVADVRERRKRVTSAEMALEMYRTIRWRNRR